MLRHDICTPIIHMASCRLNTHANVYRVEVWAEWNQLSLPGKCSEVCHAKFLQFIFSECCKKSSNSMCFYSQEASMLYALFLIATLAVCSNPQEVCRLESWALIPNTWTFMPSSWQRLAKYEAKGWRVNSMSLMQILSAYLLSKWQFKQISQGC